MQELSQGNVPLPLIGRLGLQVNVPLPSIVASVEHTHRCVVWMANLSATVTQAP